MKRMSCSSGSKPKLAQAVEVQRLHVVRGGLEDHLVLEVPVEADRGSRRSARRRRGGRAARSRRATARGRGRAGKWPGTWCPPPPRRHRVARSRSLRPAQNRSRAKMRSWKYIPIPFLQSHTPFRRRRERAGGRAGRPARRRPLPWERGTSPTARSPSLTRRPRSFPSFAISMALPINSPLRVRPVSLRLNLLGGGEGAHEIPLSRLQAQQRLFVGAIQTPTKFVHHRDIVFLGHSSHLAFGFRDYSTAARWTANRGTTGIRGQGPEVRERPVLGRARTRFAARVGARAICSCSGGFAGAKQVCGGSKKTWENVLERTLRVRLWSPKTVRFGTGGDKIGRAEQVSRKRVRKRTERNGGGERIYPQIAQVVFAFRLRKLRRTGRRRGAFSEGAG